MNKGYGDMIYKTWLESQEKGRDSMQSQLKSQKAFREIEKLILRFIKK